MTSELSLTYFIISMQQYSQKKDFFIQNCTCTCCLYAVGLAAACLRRRTFWPWAGGAVPDDVVWHPRLSRTAGDHDFPRTSSPQVWASEGHVSGADRHVWGHSTQQGTEELLESGATGWKLPQWCKGLTHGPLGDVTEFRYVIFKYIPMTDILSISREIALRWMHQTSLIMCHQGL